MRAQFVQMAIYRRAWFPSGNGPITDFRFKEKGTRAATRRQKAAFKTLRRQGAIFEAGMECVKFDLTKLTEKIFAVLNELAAQNVSRPTQIFLGKEEFLELAELSQHMRLSPDPITFLPEAFCGLKITMVPYMKGFLVV